MKKKIIISAAAVLVIAALSVFCFCFRIETGTYANAKSGDMLYISLKDNSPMLMYEKPLVLGRLQSGDRILVIRTKWVEETYPAQTDVKLCMKLRKYKDGDKELSRENYPELFSMGWLGGKAVNDDTKKNLISFKNSVMFIFDKWSASDDILKENFYCDCDTKKIIPESKKGNMRIEYYPNDDFAVCGTMLVESKIELDNGMAASVGYYDGSKDWSFARIIGSHGYVFINEGLSGEDAVNALEMIKTFDLPLDSSIRGSVTVTSADEGQKTTQTPASAGKTGANGSGTQNTTEASAGNYRNNKVYVSPFGQKTASEPLNDSKAAKVREIVGKYKMKQFSWDNLPDYDIRIDGVYYSYQSDNGIITKDDTHADKLSEEDRKALNKVIVAVVPHQETEQPLITTGHPATRTDYFVIKKVSGTYLEMLKVLYGDKGEDFEKSLYACDYGELDGSADMKFNVGDRVTIRYDVDVAETFPYQITVREIYPTVWN